MVRRESTVKLFGVGATVLVSSSWLKGKTGYTKGGAAVWIPGNKVPEICLKKLVLVNKSSELVGIRHPIDSNTKPRNKFVHRELKYF